MDSIVRSLLVLPAKQARRVGQISYTVGRTDPRRDGGGFRILRCCIGSARASWMPAEPRSYCAPRSSTAGSAESAVRCALIEATRATPSRRAMLIASREIGMISRAAGG